jgi:hypothetical protein
MNNLSAYQLGLFLHERAERIVMNEIQGFPILPENGPQSMT